MARSVLALLLVLAAALAACGREAEPRVPAACEEGPGAVRAALRAAPGEVRLSGGTRLSDCFARTGEQGAAVAVGTVFLGAALPLSRAARERPESPEALQLGYLVGAARRGAERTPVVYDELLRRLEQELVGLSSRQFSRGETAGRSDG